MGVPSGMQPQPTHALGLVGLRRGQARPVRALVSCVPLGTPECRGPQYSKAVLGHSRPPFLGQRMHHPPVTHPVPQRAFSVPVLLAFCWSPGFLGASCCASAEFVSFSGQASPPKDCTGVCVSSSIAPKRGPVCASALWGLHRASASPDCVLWSFLRPLGAPRLLQSEP